MSRRKWHKLRYELTLHFIQPCNRGDPISVTPGRVNKYAVEISKNVYLEEDKSKKCRDYPNSEYASYMECDDQFLKDKCERVELAPIWLVDDFSQATTKAEVNHSGR